MHSKTSDVCTLNRALEGILYFPVCSPLQHKQQSLTIFAPSLQNYSNPPLQPFSWLQCLLIPHLTSPALFYPFPHPLFLPSQILSIFTTQAPLSAQDWRVYRPPPLLHPCSSACKKQIKSGMQLGKLFISVSIKVTGILADPKMKPSRRQ